MADRRATVTSGSVCQIPIIPHSVAAVTFASMSSMNTHSSGARPISPAACRKIRCSGLRMPTSCEMTTASNSSGKSSRG